MAKKQLRTVKKSNDTGRLNRDDVRSAVISARDARTGNGHASSTAGARSTRSSRSSRSAATRALAA
ncbi:MAG TPA: hypothetical protein VGB15_03685 [Longimicrobium sp.]|jgi:hypothetical protein